MAGETVPTLDGREAWATLPPERQAAIGAAALELVLCWVGLDAEPAHPATERTRLFEAAESHLSEFLLDAVVAAIPTLDADLVPLPDGWTAMTAPAADMADVPDLDDADPCPTCGGDGVVDEADHPELWGRGLPERRAGASPLPGLRLMTDPYLQALDDVAAELTKLQQLGPDLPAFHRGQILEQLGTLAGAIEELRRRRQAPAQDPGPVPSVPAPGIYWILQGWRPRPEYEPAKLVYLRDGLPQWEVLGDDCHLYEHPAVIGPRLIPPAAPAPASEPADPVAEDRADWDAAPRW